MVLSTVMMYNLTATSLEYYQDPYPLEKNS